MTKRILTAMCAAMMAMSMATSCGGDGSSSTASGESSTGSTGTSTAEGSEGGSTGTCQDTGCVWDAYTPYEETVTFTKGMQISTGGENLPEGDDYLNNDYTRYVKETVNVQPEIAWEVDANSYEQKVSLSIATGDIPDMMIVDRTVYKQLLENDLIWEMSEVYEKCISDYLRTGIDTFGGERLWEQVRVNGEIYGIPGTQLDGQHNLFWIRKDWLDELGMEIPSTLEEVEAAARAFIENDMSGTGNTIGFTATEDVYGSYNGQHGLYSVFNYFDAYPEQWIEVDGQVTYGSIQPEMKDALEKIRSWYEEGLLDQEFAVRQGTDREALISSGQCGIMFGPWWGYGGVPESIQNNPDADWAVVSAPKDESGMFHRYAIDPLNGILVVSKNFEHPEAIVKALNAEYDIMRGNGDGAEAYKEMQATSPNMLWSVCPVPLQTGGDPRTTFQGLYDTLMECLETGDKTPLDEVGFGSIYDAVIREQENPKADPYNWQEAFIRTEGTAALLDPDYVLQDVVFYGTTDTMTQRWANLETLETETMVKIITGEEPIEYFDEFVETWRSMGGDTIIEEVQAEVDAMK